MLVWDPSITLTDKAYRNLASLLKKSLVDFEALKLGHVREAQTAPFEFTKRIHARVERRIVC